LVNFRLSENSAKYRSARSKRQNDPAAPHLPGGHAAIRCSAGQPVEDRGQPAMLHVLRHAIDGRSELGPRIATHLP
jgi:hypothetical protein